MFTVRMLVYYNNGILQQHWLFTAIITAYFNNLQVKTEILKVAASDKYSNHCDFDYK
jgi:hypothetical protein